MTDQNLSRRLAQLQDCPPSLPLSQVIMWVRNGRPKPVFHASVWLSRVE